MNAYDHAVAILYEARDMLAERLLERVLESREKILDEARGETYLSEIETLYDQLGCRLVHLNQMLSNFANPASEPMEGARWGGSSVFDDSIWMGPSPNAVSKRIAEEAFPVIESSGGAPSSHYVGVGLAGSTSADELEQTHREVVSFQIVAANRVACGPEGQENSQLNNALWILEHTLGLSTKDAKDILLLIRSRSDKNVDDKTS